MKPGDECSNVAALTLAALLPAQSTPTPAAPLKSNVFVWDELPVTPNKLGARRAVLEGSTTSVDKLQHLVRTHCYDDMRVLLDRVLATFQHPELRVAVTGYFPILSEDSLASDQTIELAWQFMQP